MSGTAPITSRKYRAYVCADLERIPELSRISPEQRLEMKAVADYVDYDLVGSPPELRSSVSSEAVLQDARDQYQDPDTADVLGGFSGPARLLVVSRGLLDQPPGLYPDEDLVRWRGRLHSLTIEKVPELNHYTIMFDPSGAARIAAAVCMVR